MSEETKQFRVLLSVEMCGTYYQTVEAEDEDEASEIAEGMLVPVAQVDWFHSLREAMEAEELTAANAGTSSAVLPGEIFESAA
jgi:hypothetical protein